MLKDDIIWLVRGRQRKDVFLNLPDNEFLPNKFRKQLNNKIPLSLREMSRHLKDFSDRDLVECMNKDDPYNKIYKITKKGKDLKLDILKKFQ